ncbi:hypothetical protein [Legionella sp. 16cNR16C]|uniref:hypothetical protein n=1 Tax=Legionella sp. 16cNR16C TaxID=2905656 RepID=UPI001E2E5BCD|nr:hypothetical protein [Legionella sp. 16cNR16C]MCE3046041.1 hypothetical protein [Legionella sp. 16cNR16C]
MYLKPLAVLIISMLWSGGLSAMVPVEILQSCKNMEPANDTLTMKLLDDAGLSDKTDRNCSAQYESIIDNKLYGWATCDDKPYLIIANKKFSTESAENYSMNPSVKPDIPIISHPLWYRIDKDEKSYLCLLSPLSDTGSAANSWQYYIVEDAFDASKTEYNISYYFFDKNVYKRF